MNKELNLKEMKKLNEGKYLANYVLIYSNKANKEKTFELVSRNKNLTIETIGEKVAGVAIVAFHKTLNKILLLQEFRMGANKTIINLVSGMTNKGETIEDCIKREFSEETGIKDITIKKVLKPAFSAVGMSDDKVTLVFVEMDGEYKFEDNTSDNEKIVPKFYSREEVKDLLETTEFASNSQAICYLWANGLC